MEGKTQSAVFPNFVRKIDEPIENKEFEQFLTDFAILKIRLQMRSSRVSTFQIKLLNWDVSS